jgi:uncharacterized protein with von Willebrand factor type A (vWA) domain
MEVTLTRFVHALRSAEMPVSPAETLDGFEVVQHIGIADPQLLENSLSLTLAKTQEEKARFADCFERFFHQLAFQQPAKKTMLRSVDTDALTAEVWARTGSDTLTEVIGAIVNRDLAALAWKVQAAAEQVHLHDMQTLRDKSRYAAEIARTLGVQDLEALIMQPESVSADHLPALRYLRQYIQQQIRDYVDAQYELDVDATGKRALLTAALKSNLDQLPLDYYQEVDRVVAKLADRLAQQHRRRRKKAQRGVLDLKRTIRENIAYDGALFDLRWRQKRVEKSAVYVVCDVSNSVASIARFLLLFLHGLTGVLPQVRAFAFSNRLGEITEQFRSQSVERAVEEAMFDWGKGISDYGASLVDFRDLVHQELDHRSTLIFLGDARGNYFDPRLDVFKHLSRRVKQVFWLNPETRDRWDDGDSDMRRYAAHCLRVDVCRGLKDIERFADRLLSATR